MPLSVTDDEVRLFIDPVQFVTTGVPLSIFAVIVNEVSVTAPRLNMVTVGVKFASQSREDGLLIKRGCAS